MHAAVRSHQLSAEGIPERELMAGAPGSRLIKLALRLSTTSSYPGVRLAGESVQVVHGVRRVI